MLQPPAGVRERILLMGAPGSGKTYATLQLARALPESNFYIIDTDMKVEPMLATEFSALTNVHVYPVYSWEQIIAALNDILPKLRPQDWISVDLISPAWDRVQNFYINQVFGTDPAAYFLGIRQDMQQNKQAHKDKRGGFEGFKDWGVINKLYQEQFVGPLFYMHKANVIATASMDTISAQDGEDLKVLFGPHGVKPKGQKHTGHHFRTTIIFRCAKPGEDYRMTTVRDDGRVAMAGDQNVDFSVSYLIRIAGWRPAVVPVSA